jgi:hypothetical protein
LIAQLLLHAVTFAVERILELPAADLLAIHFGGEVIAPANQVTTHAGQNERHDNDTEIILSTRLLAAVRKLSIMV